MRSRPWGVRVPVGTAPGCSRGWFWVDHVLRTLADEGRAAVLLPSRLLDNERPADIQARAKLLETGLLDAVLTVPPRLSAGARQTLLLLDQNRIGREDKVLFVDSGNVGEPESGRHRQVLIKADIEELVQLVDEWRRQEGPDDFLVQELFARWAYNEEVAASNILAPRRFVGTQLRRAGGRVSRLKYAAHRPASDSGSVCTTHPRRTMARGAARSRSRRRVGVRMESVRLSDVLVERPIVGVLTISGDGWALQCFLGSDVKGAGSCRGHPLRSREGRPPESRLAEVTCCS